MKNLLLSLFVISSMLVGCSNDIDAIQAEQIAIQTAIDEDYTNPQLYTDYDTITRETYHYAKSYNKDIEVWEVSLVTEDRAREVGILADIIYYIDRKNGDIIDKVSGVD